MVFEEQRSKKIDEMKKSMTSSGSRSASKHKKDIYDYLDGNNNECTTKLQNSKDKGKGKARDNTNHNTNGTLAFGYCDNERSQRSTFKSRKLRGKEKFGDGDEGLGDTEEGLGDTEMVMTDDTTATDDYHHYDDEVSGDLGDYDEFELFGTCGSDGGSGDEF